MSISNDGLQSRADTGLGEVVLATFINPTQGWAFHRNGRLSSTSDGGRSWNLIFTPSGSENFYLPQQLIFVDELHGWLIGLFSVWKTIDGGKTWIRKFSVAKEPEEKVGRLYRGVFLGNDSGWISTTGGVVLHMSNAGETWKTVSPTPDLTDFHDVFFIDEQKGWIAGRPHGGLYFTGDGGTTWRRQFRDDSVHLNSVSFIDSVEGWASGWRRKGEPASREALLMRTTDGGLHWAALDNTPSDSVFALVRFSDKNRGWLAGRDTLYRTEDGGKNWKVILKLPPVLNTAERQ